MQLSAAPQLPFRTHAAAAAADLAGKQQLLAIQLDGIFGGAMWDSSNSVHDRSVAFKLAMQRTCVVHWLYAIIWLMNNASRAGVPLVRAGERRPGL
jgi:hypothetical protein